MKILLDNCVDIRAKRFFEKHEVLHARDLGWRDLENGKLLAAAAAGGFALFVTVDKNIRFQQNLSALPLSVLEIDVVKNRLADLEGLRGSFERAIEKTVEFRFVRIARDGAIETLAPKQQ